MKREASEPVEQLEKNVRNDESEEPDGDNSDDNAT